MSEAIQHRPLKQFHAYEINAAYVEACEAIPESTCRFLGGSAGLNLPASDIDVFMLVPDLDTLAEKLVSKGFKVKGSHGYTNANFIPFRRGDLNIVAMSDKHEFDQTQLAYKVCQYLVSESILPTKEQRKVIHRILREEPVTFVTP